MKLDLIAIRKLSPAGLWDLVELATVISMLMNVIGGSFGGSGSVRRTRRLLTQYRQQLREQRLENFNMQVKAWVMQCPERIAHVRGVIGEVAIKRWKKNLLIDYVFTKAFGDWKSAFPNGVKHTDKAPKQNIKRRYRSKFHGYNWKPFALVKIPNAVRLLYGQAKSTPLDVAEFEQCRAAYFKLWGVDIADTAECGAATRPRSARAISPVRFTLSELVADAATQIVQEVVETPEPKKLTCEQIEIFPPPEHELEHTATSSDALEEKPS